MSVCAHVLQQACGGQGTTCFFHWFIDSHTHVQVPVCMPQQVSADVFLNDACEYMHECTQARVNERTKWLSCVAVSMDICGGSLPGYSSSFPLKLPTLPEKALASSQQSSGLCSLGGFVKRASRYFSSCDSSFHHCSLSS